MLERHYMYHSTQAMKLYEFSNNPFIEYHHKLLHKTVWYSWAVRETNARPLANASAFWAGRVENRPGRVDFCIEHFQFPTLLRQNKTLIHRHYHFKKKILATTTSQTIMLSTDLSK